ncbi:MAG: phosphatidate cytidylyltransferase [Mesorhizobium sp.]|nr:phosphatidate cytidylyltransferase [Mesorhizobium sp.]
MSNLQLRTVSGVVLAALVLSLTWYGGWPFRALAVLIGALVFHEWSTLSGMRGDRRWFIGCWALLGIVLAALMLGASAATVLILAVGATVMAAVAGRQMGQGGEGAVGLAYAAFPAIALAFLRDHDAAGFVAVIYLFAVVWATDILAYFTGRAIGGPKLAPSISPGKTWSGAVGGTAAAVLAGFAVALAAGHSAPLLMAALALPLSAVSQIGDLFESAFKRRHGAKDSGSIIPGHGGVMDRVDGLVAAAIALYLAGSLMAGPDFPARGLFPL